MLLMKERMRMKKAAFTRYPIFSLIIVVVMIIIAVMNAGAVAVAAGSFTRIVGFSNGGIPAPPGFAVAGGRGKATTAVSSIFSAPSALLAVRRRNDGPRWVGGVGIGVGVGVGGVVGVGVEKRPIGQRATIHGGMAPSGMAALTTSYDQAAVQDDGFDLDEDDEVLEQMPVGNPRDFRVVKRYDVPAAPDGFSGHPLFLSPPSSLGDDRSGQGDEGGFGLTGEDVARLDLRPDNVTLPVALMLLDPDAYPTQSRARKACRKGSILVHRGPLRGKLAPNETHFGKDNDVCIRGKVDCRVFPGDVIAKQVRMGGGFYPSMTYRKPPFDLPVLYEDDHFAIVNKPAGVVVYSQRKHGHGTNSVKSALPFVLRPPGAGIEAILRLPQPVHRLDKPTSGILLVAKTKAAHVDLTRQFVERRIKKTYHAVLNGVPSESPRGGISSADAFDLGVDVPIDDGDHDGGGDPPWYEDRSDDDSTTTTGTTRWRTRGDDASPSSRWQIIDEPIENRSAVTVWRTVDLCASLRGAGGALALVELKPKTGRRHQLRRHMAMFTGCPVVGDTRYDGGDSKAIALRGRGLFLCSNRVMLEHPFFNSEVGRNQWAKQNSERAESFHVGRKETSVQIWEDMKSGKVMVRASIALPQKFCSLFKHENNRAQKFLL